MSSDERERARARSVARTALAIFTPPLTASGDDDGAHSQEHSRLLLLVRRRCYLGRDWLTCVRTHAHARAKRCTLGGLPASLFFPTSLPLCSDTHASIYVISRARAHFARTRYISIVGDLCMGGVYIVNARTWR